MNVPFRGLVLEALRSIWSRPIWAAVTVLMAVAVGVVCGASVVEDARAVDAREQRLMAQGWGLITVSSAAGGTVDSGACVASAGVSGVTRAGAVGPTREVGALGLEAGLALTPVTRDVIDIAWPDSRPAERTAGLLTPGFVALSGLGAGGLHLDVGGALVPLPSEPLTGPGRHRVLDGGVLVVRADLADVSHCLVETTGERVEQVALDVAAAAVSYGVIAVPVLSRDDATPTPADLVDDHRSRNVPVLGAMFLLLVGAMRLVRSRRDRAVYRLLSFGRGDLWAMGLLDYATCLAVPLSSAFVVVVLWAELTGVPTGVLGVHDLASLSLAVAGGGLVYATAGAMGRNRHQFAPGE